MLAYKFGDAGCMDCIEIHPMNEHDAKEWDKTHKPSGSKKVGSNWHITLVYRATKVINAMHRKKLTNHSYDCYVMKFKQDILGFFMVANNYSCFETTIKEKIPTFLLFLAKSEISKSANAFKSINVENSMVKSIRLLSYAIMYQKSQDRIWLHADPKGGDKLVSDYDKELKRCIPKLTLGVINFTHRRFDNRYFYAERDFLKKINSLVFKDEI